MNINERIGLALRGMAMGIAEVIPEYLEELLPLSLEFTKH